MKLNKLKYIYIYIFDMENLAFFGFVMVILIYTAV